MGDSFHDFEIRKGRSPHYKRDLNSIRMEQDGLLNNASSCHAKMKYEAKAAKSRAKKMRAENKISGAWCMMAYKCKWCKQWHVGHSPMKMMKKQGMDERENTQGTVK